MHLNFILTYHGSIRADFTDMNNIKCSIQESSLATGDAIWLGRNEGLHDSDTGECMARMHLNRSQVAELIPALQFFVKHGQLPPVGYSPPLTFKKILKRIVLM